MLLPPLEDALELATISLLSRYYLGTISLLRCACHRLKTRLSSVPGRWWEMVGDGGRWWEIHRFKTRLSSVPRKL